MRDDGRRRMYRVNGHALKPIHDRVKGYEQSWSERFDLLDDVLQDLKHRKRGDAGDAGGLAPMRYWVSRRTPRENMSPRRPATSPFRQRAALRQLQAIDTSRPTWADEPLSVHRVQTGSDLLALDHVALCVADPEAMAHFLCEHVGMQRLPGKAGFAVVGAGPGAATLALVAADGAREPGALARVVLRVSDVERALALLPAGTPVDGDRIEQSTFEGPEGLALGFTLVAGGGIDYDIDHVVLRCADPPQTGAALAEAGFVPRGQAFHVTDKYVTLSRSPGSTQRPLLHHLAVRVDSVDAIEADARERSFARAERVADDTFAVVLAGSEQIGLHFVQQDPPA